MCNQNSPCDVHMCDALTHRKALLSTQWPLQSSTDVSAPFRTLSALSAVKCLTYTRTQTHTHTHTHGNRLRYHGDLLSPSGPRVACLLPDHMASLSEQWVCVWALVRVMYWRAGPPDLKSIQRLIVTFDLITRITMFLSYPRAHSKVCNRQTEDLDSVQSRRLYIFEWSFVLLDCPKSSSQIHVTVFF